MNERAVVGNPNGCLENIFKMNIHNFMTQKGFTLGKEPVKFFFALGVLFSCSILF